MEFNLLRDSELEFKIRGSSGYQKSPKERKVDSITRVRSNSYPVTLTPVLDDNGETSGYGNHGTKCFEISCEMLLGKTTSANQLKRGWSVLLAVHLTLNSSNTGRLRMETKTGGDIFGGLYNLQESLPPNSMEFILSLKDLSLEHGRNFWPWHFVNPGVLNFKEKGLRLSKNRRGIFSLETGDLHFPTASWWEEWRDGRVSFTGVLQLNLKLDIAAVTELFKKHFAREGPLAPELDMETADMVILVGGSQDKDKGIKCHKSILTEMSPVFEAMFQLDMVERKEGTLRIVEFSEACVRALVEFAYRRNMEEPLKNSEIALEMLQAAHMYQMKELMDLLLQIILAMPFSWFSANVAVKLFVFARNAGEDLGDAEKKGGMALKWYAKKFPEQLNESQEYVRLSENPEVMRAFGLEALKGTTTSCVIT